MVPRCKHEQQASYSELSSLLQSAKDLQRHFVVSIVLP